VSSNHDVAKYPKCVFAFGKASPNAEGYTPGDDLGSSFHHLAVK
jgi:hypothetical protein